MAMEISAHAALSKGQTGHLGKRLSGLDVNRHSSRCFAYVLQDDQPVFEVCHDWAVIAENEACTLPRVNGRHFRLGNLTKGAGLD